MLAVLQILEAKHAVECDLCKPQQGGRAQPSDNDKGALSACGAPTREPSSVGAWLRFRLDRNPNLA